jgi:26S proteasome regulatory subunit N11
MELTEKSAPPAERTAPHKWLDRNALRKFHKRSAYGLELYLSKLAEERIRNHANSKLSQRLEVMGFLLGTVHRCGDNTFALVKDVATTSLEATSVSVRFERGGLEDLFGTLETTDFNYVIVGWYHSHPGHGCFLSEIDVETQRRMFDRSWHSAIVIDPVQQDIAAFSIKDHKVEERPFAIYWDEYQNPYYGESVRNRRIRSDPDGVPASQ